MTATVQGPGATPLVLLLVGRVVIGRECDGLIVSDPMVSRQHLEIEPVEDGVMVSDLGSRNGTIVNGEPLSGRIFVSPGGVIRLGDTNVTIGRIGAPAPSRSHDTVTMTGMVPFDPKATSIESVAAVAIAEAAPPPRPHTDGTITIAFSDIENSTDHLVSAGDQAWMQTLAAHDELVRNTVRTYRGRVVKNVGDGFMMSFPSARGAVDAMSAIQRRLSTSDDAALSGIRVRIGMHTGEAVTDDSGDLFGQHVNLAARVGCQADGGEILVSALTRAILETAGDLRFGEPRETEFQGIPGTHLVHPVRWQDTA